jgi:antitoxin MazE
MPFPSMPAAACLSVYMLYLLWYILRITGDERGHMPTAQIVKWGNSLAVRIPKPVAEEAGVREGDPIVIEAAAGEISLRRKQRTPTLKELVAQITPENRYEATPAGAERGKESVEW